jgi:hypothetical protein
VVQAPAAVGRVEPTSSSTADCLVRRLGLELGPRPAGSPESARAAETVAAAFAAAGAQVRTERFDYLGWRGAPVALEIDGETWAAGPCTWSLPTPAGGTVGTVRELGVLAIMAGLFEAPAFAIVSDSGDELARLYVNPLEAPAAALPSGRGPSLTGRAAWLSAADGRRLAQRPGARARLVVDDGTAAMSDVNVIGEVAGASAETVIVGAHYDAAWRAPGIVDNATGVEWVRRTIAHVAAGPRPRRTLRACAWAAEEVGLLGARQHAGLVRAGAGGRVRAVVNVDAVGGSPRLVVQATLEGEVADLARRAAARLDGRFEVELQPPGPGSDHFAFHEVGVPVVAFVGPPTYPAYHQPGETAEDLDWAALDAVDEAAGELVDALLWAG